MTQHVFNGAVAGATRLGISIWGSRVLRVKGRTSGQWRSTPVNLLTNGGDRYLVAPRGETQWVRNLRVAGGGELLLGRHIEAFRAVELPDEEKPPLLRAYLKRWKAEVGVFFDGVSSSSPEEELTANRPPAPGLQGGVGLITNLEVREPARLTQTPHLPGSIRAIHVRATSFTLSSCGGTPKCRSVRFQGRTSGGLSGAHYVVGRPRLRRSQGA
jgi:deazaflavin-dependent oxidoreductase (nitroreductase family)